MKDFEKIDQLLWQVISSDIEPKDSLNRKIIHMAKEKEKDKNVTTKRFSTIALCAILIVVSSMTVFAAWQLLTPKQIAESIGNKGLAIAFESEDAVFIDQEYISGDYKVTLIGIVSGKGLSDFVSLVEETQLEKSYVVVAIAKMDGTKMPELKDLEYDEVPFFVSPFIKGLDPKTYNIFTMNGGYSERIIEGVLYRIIECNDVEIFADRGLYIGVTSSKFYDIHAYDFDAVTGEITANLDYQGVNILFDLPIDPSKGNQEKVENYLQSSFDLVEEELNVNEYERMDANYKDIVYDHESFCMNLIDWQTNQIVKKLQLENTELIFRTFRLNQGFAAVVGVDENEIDRKKGYINFKDFESTVIRIYDSQLNLLHEINLKSVFSNATDLSHFVVDVSPDGEKIAWASLQTLSIYDIALGTLTKVYEEVNPEALIFYEIHFNEDGKSIVYFSGDGENSTSYGIVDLSTGDMKNLREDEYTNASKINVSGQFACITNSLDGAGRTSGKVLILDLLNKKGLSMKVDGAESLWARVSENGKFLIAASVNQYGQIRIRQYLVSTGEIIKEEVLMSGDEKFYITNIIEGEEPLKYYILGKGENQFREGFVFDGLEK